MHDPAVDLDLVERGQLCFRALELVDEGRRCLLRGVVLHLERPDAGCGLHDSGEGAVGEPRVERVGPETEVEVERHRPVLDEHRAIALCAVHHLGSVTIARDRAQDGGPRTLTSRAGSRRRRARVYRSVGCSRSLVGFGDVDGHEPHAVPRRELAELPTVVGNHRQRACEPAETRAVGTEHDRHVAGEVDRADRVRAVVDVRRMEPGLAAVGPRPLDRRADKANPGAIGVVMDDPLRRVQRRDPGVGHEVGRAMRAVDHGELPLVREHGEGDHTFAPGVPYVVVPVIVGADVEHVARAQRAAAVAAETAEREGGCGAQRSGDVEAAAHQQIRAEPDRCTAVDDEVLSGLHVDRLAERHRIAVEVHVAGGAGEAHDRATPEAQRRAAGGALESGCALSIADDAIPQPEGAVVHRSARRHAHVPQPRAAREVLHGGVPGRQHLDRRRQRRVRLERRRRERSAPVLVGRDERRHELDVGLDPVHAGVVEGAGELLHRLRARRCVHDHLGEQRIVEGGHLGARSYPRVDAGTFGPTHGSDQTGTRAVALERVFGVHARFDRVTADGYGPLVEECAVTHGEAHHPFHEVDVGHRFGDRVLDLQPRVHLEERARAGVDVVQELDRARRPVLDQGEERGRRVEQLVERRVVDPFWRRLLDHLLAPALHGAVAYSEALDPATAVTEHLHLEVPSPVNQFLEEHVT